jgi:flagellar protein FlgJ
MQVDAARMSGTMQNDFSVARFKAEADQVSTSFVDCLAKAAEKAGDDQETVRLKSACRDLEAVFLNLMWTSMRATVPKASLMGGGFGEDIMRSMQDTELTKTMAQAGGMGLADMIYRQLSKTDNIQKNQASK